MVSAAATVAVGLAVGAAFVLILGTAAALSPAEHCRDSGQSDYVSFSVPFWERVSEEIVIGKVASVESRNAIDPYDFEIKRFTFVTIDVQYYFKDGSQKRMSQLTFRDYGSAACYPYGEKAVFFIWRSGDNTSLQSNWFTSKFVINESNGTAQSAQLAREEPKNLQEFENEIRLAVANPK